MNNHLIITKDQANTVRGRYGIYSAIDPILLPDENYIVPEACINDMDLLGAKSVLETMNTNIQPIDDLPVIGETVYSGRTYNYPEGLISGYSQFVICVQTHTRMDYYPWDTPALFTFTRPNSDNLDWIPNERVYIGWYRVYSAVTYECIMEHMTQIDWTPPQTLGILWSVVSGGDAWAPGISYVINDEVTYGGHTYKCLQAHTSLLGWEPPNVPALWQLIS